MSSLLLLFLVNMYGADLLGNLFLVLVLHIYSCCSIWAFYLETASSWCGRSKKICNDWIIKILWWTILCKFSSELHFYFWNALSYLLSLSLSLLVLSMWGNFHSQNYGVFVVLHTCKLLFLFNDDCLDNKEPINLVISHISFLLAFTFCLFLFLYETRIIYHIAGPERKSFWTKTCTTPSAQQVWLGDRSWRAGLHYLSSRREGLIYFAE